MSYDRHRKMRYDLDADDEAIEAKLRESDRERKRQERCEATGKRVWRKRSGAAAAARVQRRSNADPFLAVYLCSACGGFHVGHEPGTRRMREELIRASGGAA